MRRFATVLDTVAGFSFNRIDEIPHRLRGKIEPLGDDVTNIKVVPFAT